MTEKIYRNYLEIKLNDDFKAIEKPSENYAVELIKPKDFHVNKFWKLFCDFELKFDHFIT